MSAHLIEQNLARCPEGHSARNLSLMENSTTNAETEAERIRRPAQGDQQAWAELLRRIAGGCAVWSR
jgi:hypothetical protein